MTEDDVDVTDGPVDATTTAPDKEDLEADLEQIKRAVGLRESHPYWWRWWLVEGVGVAILFPLLNVGFVEGFSVPLIAAIVGGFLAHQYLLARIQRDYEEPSSAVPSWGHWHLAFFAGIAALYAGVYPIYGEIEGVGDTPLLLVALGVVLGVAYLYMGQLLAAFDVRRADRTAFYVGGAVILVVSAALPWVPAIEGWEFATLGVAYGAYSVAAYVALARI